MLRKAPQTGLHGYWGESLAVGSGQAEALGVHVPLPRKPEGRIWEGPMVQAQPPCRHHHSCAQGNGPSAQKDYRSISDQGLPPLPSQPWNSGCLVLGHFSFPLPASNLGKDMWCWQSEGLVCGSVRHV